MSTVRDLGIWGLFVAAGFVVGSILSVVFAFVPAVDSDRTSDRKPPRKKSSKKQKRKTDDTPNYVPLPHFVPQNDYYRGGLSLRFSMVHDVLLERYPRHSKAWYRHRNEQSRDIIQTKETWSSEEEIYQFDVFEAYDNLAVGLDRLNKSRKAVEVLREKKKLQEKFGLSGQNLYTTHANLSTHLIHAHFSDAIKGDDKARQKIQEALGYLQDAVDQKLGTYFNREPWQMIAVQFFLSASEHPQRLLKFDFVGNRLNEKVDPESGQPYRRKQEYLETIRGQSVDDLEEPENEQLRSEYRSFIARLERAPEYRSYLDGDEPETVPFDEPVLAIIGMWRLGGGPNPHFALALGEIMLRVGKPKIAWEAYERAIRMGDQFWHKPEVRRKLIEHCRDRQDLLEQALNRTESSLRSAFDRAMDWRDAYQSYETKKLKAGHSVDEEDFHKSFFEQHDRIASNHGRQDWLKTNSSFEIDYTQTNTSESGKRDLTAPVYIILLVTGLFGMVGGLLIYFRPVSNGTPPSNNRSKRA